MCRILPGFSLTARHPAARPTVGTPMGELSFGAVVGPWAVPEVPEELFELPSGARVARWSHPLAELELLIGRFDPELDPEVWEPLTDCWAGVWRIDARAPLAGVTFSASLPPVLPPGAETGYDGGQGQASITVEYDGTKLTLGGPDEEQLCHEAQQTGEVPKRWAELLDEVYAKWPHLDWGVDYGDYHGLRWTLPALEPGEHCVLAVTAAWSPDDNADDANTFFAVGGSAAWVLGRLARTEGQS